MFCLSGTGHRPNKLYKSYKGEEYLLKTLEIVIPRIEKEIHQIDCGLSGLALGFDIALAKTFIKFKIPWTAAIPFRGQESKWPANSQKEYHNLLSQATNIVYVDELNSQPPGYSIDKLQKRNKYLVNECDV